MAMAGVAPPFDASAFCAIEQATLSDTLTPHLDAYDLAALACVARTFRAWPTLTHRKCRLAPRHKFEPHGYRDGQPVMLKKRLIKVDVLLLEKYTSASGRQWPRMVAPAAQVDARMAGAAAGREPVREGGALVGDGRRREHVVLVLL